MFGHSEREIISEARRSRLLPRPYSQNMGQIVGNLWEYNMAKVIVVDVTDDYKLMQPPMPSDYYPVLVELWLPRHNLRASLAASSLVEGYLYDWHETPTGESGSWYVGVVHEELTTGLNFEGSAHTA